MELPHRGLEYSDPQAWGPLMTPGGQLLEDGSTSYVDQGHRMLAFTPSYTQSGREILLPAITKWEDSRAVLKNTWHAGELGAFSEAMPDLTATQGLACKRRFLGISLGDGLMAECTRELPAQADLSEVSRLSCASCFSCTSKIIGLPNALALTRRLRGAPEGRQQGQAEEASAVGRRASAHDRSPGGRSATRGRCR